MLELSPRVLTVLLGIAKTAIVVLVMTLKTLDAEHKQTREEFLAYKLHVAENYATKDLINDNFERLNQRIDKLFEELTRR